MTDSLLLPVKAESMEQVVQRLIGREADDQRFAIEPLWEWALATEALVGARGRYLKALGAARVLDARAAVGEALWWIASADEFLFRRISKGATRREYWEALGRNRGGRLIGALTFVRHRAGHHLAQVLAGTDSSEVRAPFTVRQPDGTSRESWLTARVSVAFAAPFAIADPAGFRFVREADLPPADPGMEERNGRDTWYSETVEGRAVGDVLDEAEAVLGSTLAVVRSDGHLAVSLSLDTLPGSG